ncbi:glycoside hydrolase family 25 protein [Erythrobacter sp.]|uniref:glycoside hydrolase family 25 protein n=1 Tax=Erythrobacter sp. TaxID=1042 RepID=UPI001425F4F9|nr:glycoside hydrolase family 25 protein [Erythrobacter sp.]QIQ87826.1 MAG: lysozyme M1 precursor [Erythrobacter sp.]
MAKARLTNARRRKLGAGGRIIRLMWQGFALLVLATILYSGWLWVDMRGWRPAEELYPEQGAVIASGTSGTRFETLKALGAQFVYLELASSDAVPDPGLAARMDAARAAGLKVGLAFPFDLCARADPQSARFTRMVPRDDDLLPPALILRIGRIPCTPPVSEAAVESELMTLVNQIEMHAGRPVILKLGPAFEQKYRTAATMERDLWLMRDRAEPDYAGRPWLLWSANGSLMTEASEDPVEWVVVQK